MPGPLDPNMLAGLLSPPVGFGQPAPAGFGGTSMWTGIPSGTSGLAADMPALAGKPRQLDLATALRGLRMPTAAGRDEMLSQWFGPQRVR